MKICERLFAGNRKNYVLFVCYNKNIEGRDKQ